MTFAESLYLIEKDLYVNRMMSSITQRDIRGNKLHLSVVYNIERHKDYIVDYLFKYAKISGKSIFLNDHLIENVQQLGEVLKEERISKGYSGLSFFKETGVIPKSLAKIEKGDKYRKSTLLNYMSIFSFVLTLK